MVGAKMRAAATLKRVLVVLSVVAGLSVSILVGIAALATDPGTAGSGSGNDRANHHPLVPDD